MRAIFLTTACLLISLTSIAAEKPQKKNNKPTQITSGTELAENLGDKQYHARHIMVESEPEAREIIAQLNLQTDFSKLIDKSKDAGSIEQGGSLGWVSPTDFEPPFADALRNLRKGEYSKKPVKSQFGWHIIKVDDVRIITTSSKEETKSANKAGLNPKDMGDFIRKSKEALTSNYKDPASAEFTGLVVSEGPDKIALCGKVNGKNSFGGYVGRKIFYVVYYKPGPMDRFNPVVWTEGQSASENDLNSDYAPLRQAASKSIATELDLAKSYCEASAKNHITRQE